MKNLLAIDGSPGAGKTTIAIRVAQRLGWPLATDAIEAGNVFAVIEGAGILGQQGLDPRWRFFLDAAPGERLARLANTPGGQTDRPATPPRLPAETILIDTTGIEPDAVATMIAALVHDELA